MAEMPRRSGASYREARISYLHYVFDLWVSDDNTIALCPNCAEGHAAATFAGGIAETRLPAIKWALILIANSIPSSGQDL
jgi:hypothetical protein